MSAPRFYIAKHPCDDLPYVHETDPDPRSGDEHFSFDGPDYSGWYVKQPTPDELRAAVLPLIDYEAAAKAIWRFDCRDYDYDFEGNRLGYMDQARAIVDAALGLKENE